MTRTPVRVVLWDADGVLQRVPGGGEESMRPAVEGLVEDVEAFLLEAVAAERPALTGREHWPDVLPGLLERWGAGDAYDEVLATWLSVEPVPETRELVGALRRAGVRCCLATNQAEERGRHVHRTLGYAALLDDTFYSCEMGVAKPDPGFFSRILERVDVPAAEVLLVDDSPANVAAARSLGMQAEAWSYHEDVSVLRDHLSRHGLVT